MKKRIFRKLLTVLLCAMMLVLCGCSNKTGNSEETVTEVNEKITKARTAIVFKLFEGTGISVLREENEEEAYEGMRLISGDSVMTDEVSQVYLRVDDDKNILLGTETKMNVEEISDGKLLLVLEYGEFFFHVENKLKDDETMEFQIGTTAMFIRGTSGSGTLKNGKASFAIYTGKAALNNAEEPEVEYSIMPGVIAHFDEEKPVESVQLSVIKEEEVPSVLLDYVEENEEYKEELEDKGWEISEESAVPANIEITEEESQDYAGWTQNKDGSWTFSKDNFKNEIPAEFYEEPVKTETSDDQEKEETVEKEETAVQNNTSQPIAKPEIINTTCKYDGNNHSIDFTGYDAATMTLTGTTEGKDAGKYEASISPKEGYIWSDSTSTPVTRTLTIGKKSIDVVVSDSSTLTREYGETFSASDFVLDSYDGVVTGETVSVSLAPESSESPNGLGEHNICVTLGGANAKNYKVGNVTNGTYKITTCQLSVVMTLSQNSKTYDGNPFDRSYISSIVFNSGHGVVELDSAVTIPPDVGTGTYTIQISLNSPDDNYYVIGSITGNTYSITE